MAMNSLINGLGAITGDSLVMAKPFETTGQVYWVSSLVGNNNNVGTDRENPFATAVFAGSQAAAGDTIVLMDNHAETVVSTITLKDGTTIVGEGQSGGKPTVKLRSPGVNVPVFYPQPGSGAGAEIRNIWFQSALTSNSTPTVEITAPNARVIGCYFECGVNDTIAALLLGAGCGTTDPDYVVLRNTTFISVATSRATRPSIGLRISDPADHLTMEGCVFSDGAFGWTNDFAMWADGVISHAKLTDNSFLLGASAKISATSTDRWSGTIVTGGGRIYHA